MFDMITGTRNFVALLVFSLFAQLEISSCSLDFNHDPTIRKEVEDFAEFLKLKTEREAFSNRNIHLQEPLETSDKAPDQKGHSADDGYRSLNSEEFGSLVEELTHKVPNSEKHVPEQDVYSGESLDNSPSSGEEHSAHRLKKDHHPMEEILYIRRSDSESNDPVAGVLDKLVHDDSSSDKIPQVHLDGSRGKLTEPVADEPLLDETCRTENFNSRLHQTCSEGPEYEMQFHPTFSETLRQDMEKMLPEKDPDDNKCDYSKDLTMKAGVEDRALCPFEWSISNRNPSRVPEYLYEAKCSCQVSRKLRGKRFECREVKREIPVLWITGCGHDGTKKYKQGWEEIAVACTPLEEKDSYVIPASGL